jgi:zinc/manganese transport system substrate-binding protein
MKHIIHTLLFILAALAITPAHAGLNILACEPEWSSLASEIGGNKVKTTSATTAFQDPHRIEARPSLIARARNADLLICTGLELEAGWLPVLIQQSGNSRIASGQPGYFEAGQYVNKLDIPASVDRSQGDVHAAGNPHIQQNPYNIGYVANALVNRMVELDPENTNYYRNRHKEFSTRWKTAISKWEQQTSSLRDVPIVEHHKNMEYLLHWLGMREVGTLEPKPGVEPGAAHLSKLLRQQQQHPAKMILRAGYQDARASHWLAERAKIPAVVLPFTVGGHENAKDLFGLFDTTIQMLLEVNK